MSVLESIDWCQQNGAIVRFDVDVMPDPRRPKRTKPGVLVALPSLDVSGAAETFEKAADLCRETAAKKLTRFAEKIGA